ncbi:MAG: EscU/YscU/HrcU family type III secretion system export apparatus switch protein [Oscillospiraceae bacterium]|nr:EscU/YscU/HrcU family type III secretion system export apparatus switch protein [Oscillospiraceae bacterium]
MSVYKGKKPSNAAVALKYNPETDYTPIVVASGHGHVAEKIINLADENGVPVYRDDSATALLTMLNVGQGVPPELYQLVAGIYVQIMQISKDKNKL